MRSDFLPPGSEYASFSRRLKRWRILRGYTQRELAKVSGVSERQIYNLELTHNLPQPATAEKLADALGIQTMDLWEDE